jgi:hypothetical protein
LPVVETPPVPPTPHHDLTVNDVAMNGAPTPEIPVIPGGSTSPLRVPGVDLTNLSGTIGDGPRVRVHPVSKSSDPLSRDRKQKIREFVTTYRPMKEIEEHDAAGTYPVYVAAYADGDWDCNIHRDAQGNIVAGSMPDLAAKIAEWSHGEIKAQVVPKPLDIGGSELLDTKPPFIFFTGHKDFHLTEREVGNLRDYLEEGGAIWGDNALAGRGSRFDVAFRREMKRVVPDIDENFEPLSTDADIFAKERFPLSDVPKGMNFYSEPIEHLDIDGQVAILYTPNDYSDLYAMRILPGDAAIAPDWPEPKADSPLFSDGRFLQYRDIFFRNFSLESALAVHRLGMNIVTFLITRFDDELLLSNP